MTMDFPFLASSIRHETIKLLLNLTNLLIKNYNLYYHFIPKNELIRKILAFFDKDLGPVM